MKIVVCIKQEPNTAAVKIDPITNNLVREGVPSIMNPYDKMAIKMALQLKKQAGGSVVVLSMGPRQAIKELAEALCLGADEAYLLCDRKLGGSDTLATGYALAETIKQIGYDLVLCGNEAIDGCTGQVGPVIGEYLKIPTMTYVSKIEVQEKDLLVVRDTGQSFDSYKMSTPIVICVSEKEMIQEECDDCKRTSEVQKLDARHLDSTRIGSKGSPTKVVSISTKERKQTYLAVDYRWSCEKRIEYIINGGLEKKKITLNRGNALEQANLILALLM